MVNGLAGSEMHIGMRTQAFGNVDVHTVIRDAQVGLTVGSEKGNLRSLMGPELPGLQNTLRQQELRFEGLGFSQNGAGSNAGASGGANQQSRSFGRSGTASDAAPEPVQDTFSEETPGTRDTQLSVLA
jgi:hypothetical protein